MNVKLVSKTVGADEFEGKSIEDMIVHNARVSSNRKDKFEAPEGLLKYCLVNGHVSIFEQGSLGIEIVTSRAIAAQILRHRSFTFQEFSQRYNTASSCEKVSLRASNKSNRQSSNEEINPNVQLDDWPESHPSNIIIQDVIEYAFGVYNNLISRGVAPETARMILPLCTTTTMYVNGTIRSWIHYLEQRLSEHTQLEHRLIAQEVWEIFKKECPIISKMLIEYKPQLFK